MSTTNQTNQDNIITSSIDDLAAEIAAEDQSFNPRQNTNWKIIQTEAEYPDVEHIIRNNKPAAKVLETYGNLAYLLDKFGAELRHNKMTRRREIIIPDLAIFHDDAENDILTKVENLATINKLGYKQVDKFLDVLCGARSYHPVGQAITNKPWDKLPRLDAFISTLRTTQPEQDQQLVRTWMTAAIAAIFKPEGHVNHGVLVLQGPQGIGKTAWSRKLDPIDCDAVATGVLLDPKVKDSMINANRFWIVELGELDATLNKTDIAHLKSYITSSADYIRVPWAKRETKFFRRTAYIATVNDHEFLVDTTGNRRWWTIEVTDIDYQHTFDMQQVWAEVYQGWLDGWLTYLPDELQKQVNKKNEDHEIADPMLEKLMDYYDWSAPARRLVSAGKVLQEVGISMPNKTQTIAMGKALSKVNNAKPKKINGVRCHKVPVTRNLPNNHTYCEN